MGGGGGRAAPGPGLRPVALSGHRSSAEQRYRSSEYRQGADYECDSGDGQHKRDPHLVDAHDCDLVTMVLKDKYNE